MRPIEERIQIAWVKWTNDNRPRLSSQTPSLYLGLREFEELEQALHDKGMGMNSTSDDPRMLYRNMEIVIVHSPKHLGIGMESKG